MNFFLNFDLFQLIPSIGGLPKQKTRKFLADGQEVSEEDPRIGEENVAQYSALLWPLKNMDSSDIIMFCDCKLTWIIIDLKCIHYFVVLGEPSFRSLADVETPSGMSSDFTSSQAGSLAIESSVASVLSSTAIDGASCSPANLDVSCIETKILFCEKCGQIFQKYVHVYYMIV